MFEFSDAQLSTVSLPQQNVSKLEKKTRSSAVAVIADRTAYDIRYTGKLSNRFRLIRRVNMSEYNPSLLEGLNWEGGSFAQSQYPTVVYMTFFPNDEIRKFFPGFDGTLSIQYHELQDSIAIAQ